MQNFVFANINIVNFVLKSISTQNLPIFPYQNAHNNHVTHNLTSKLHFSSPWTRKRNSCSTKYKNSTSHPMTHSWGCVLLRTVRVSYLWLKTNLLSAFSAKNNFVESACTSNTVVNARKTKQWFWTWSIITANVINVESLCKKPKHVIIWHANVDMSFAINAVENGLEFITVQSREKQRKLIIIKTNLKIVFCQ